MYTEGRPSPVREPGEHMMPINSSSSPLRTLLLLDAATCTGMGAILTLAAAPLAAWTAIPASLLFYAGAVLFPVAVFMGMVAMRALANRTAVWLVVAGNGLWVAASLGLLVGGWIAPNALGQAFIVAQALAVALFAVLEHLAGRRSSATAIA